MKSGTHVFARIVVAVYLRVLHDLHDGRGGGVAADGRGLAAEGVGADA